MVVHVAAGVAARGAAAAGRAAGRAARSATRNTRVTRKKSRRSGNRTHDHPTIDDRFRKHQYRNRYQDHKGERERRPDLRSHVQPSAKTAVRPKRKAIRQSRSAQTTSSAKTSLVGSVTQSKKLRAYGAAVTAIIWCVPLFVYQLSFWLIMLMGAGIEFGAVSYSELGFNLFERMVLWFSSSVGLGKALFSLGWILSSFIFGLPQLVVTFLAFKLWKVNPFAGQSWTMLGISIALYALPLGFFIWSVVWMLSIIENTENS